MTALTALARARAVESDTAQPVCTVRHVHVSQQPLVLVPLALAGEANAPLAAMAGHDPDAPELLIVAQPRNRDQRFAFAAALGTMITSYIEGFTGGAEVLPARPDTAGPRTRFPGAPQVWLPNRSGIGFARLLGRSTRFRRTEGEWAVDPAVPVLGRWLTYLTERAELPGSCLMLAATEALALHWASGQSPAEDLNLAALLGWIDPPPGLTGPEAAAAAEDPLTWPPAGPATDPGFDNEVLSPLIAACARAAGHPDARLSAEARLREALASQLTPTWGLMWRAIRLLRALPPGQRVTQRWDRDRDSFTAQVQYLRDVGLPQPRRDSAVTAARRLDWLERVQARYAVERALDDPLVMAEYRLTGQAFAGTVTSAQPARLDTSGPRRKLRPLITVATQDPVRIEPGTKLTSPSRPGQTAQVVSAAAGVPSAGRSGPAVGSAAVGGAATSFVLELSGGMGRSLTPAPGSVPEAGERVCYMEQAESWFAAGAFPSADETPWTHGGPPPAYVPTDEDATEAWS
jgi:hypothetical protein